MTQLPKDFCDRMKHILGDKYDEFILSYTKKPQRGVRINSNKISVKDFKKISPFGFENTNFADDCKYLIGEDKFGNHPYSHAGLFYMQEPSAMLPANCVDIKKNWKVLDLCAAPGGKSGQLASRLQDGLLISNEFVSSRSKILFGNLERQGFTNTIVLNDAPQRISTSLPAFFDLVLVDAPCSGEGMFRKDSGAISEWSLANVKACSSRQLEILSYAKKCVVGGGYLVYSTCTFSTEENEEAISKFLEENPEFSLVDVNKNIKDITVDGIALYGNNDLKKCRRFYPHVSRGEGQFMAVLKRDGAAISNNKNFSLKSPTLREQKIIDEFINKNTHLKNLNIKMANQNVYIVPDGIPELKGLKVVSCGVQIGSIIKERFEPYHSLFTCFGDHLKNKANYLCESRQINEYLTGDVTYDDSIKNGWGVMMVDGYPLGGYKAVDGQLKNHYPKGLRKQ